MKIAIAATPRAANPQRIMTHPSLDIAYANIGRDYTAQARTDNGKG